VGYGRDGGSGDGGEELHLGRELRGGLVGEQCGDGDADEGVGGIPDEVEGGDFVGEDFDGEEHARDDDDPGAGERVEAGRERDPIEAREDAEGGVKFTGGSSAVECLRGWYRRWG